jgi:DUF4097 and DUF4098 domain-containing protein YvlB
LWLFFCLLFIGSLAGSALVTVSRGSVLTEFPVNVVMKLRRALRVEREARMVEKVTSVDGIQLIHITTAATNISIKRNNDLQDLAITLEGAFLKTNTQPLKFEKTDSRISIKVEDSLGRLPWASFFDDSIHNSEISLTLPRRFSGLIEIETVSGETHLAALSLSALNWRSVSGLLENRGGEIHVVRLQSVSGDVDFNGEAIEFYMTLTSSSARLVLEGLDHLTNPKIDTQTVSGQIDLAISSKASARISMSSFTGQTTSTVELKKSMHSAGALEGQLGAGTGEIRLRSVSGSARLTTF